MGTGPTRGSVAKRWTRLAESQSGGPRPGRELLGVVGPGPARSGGRRPRVRPCGGSRCLCVSGSLPLLVWGSRTRRPREDGGFGFNRLRGVGVSRRMAQRSLWLPRKRRD